MIQATARGKLFSNGGSQAVGLPADYLATRPGNEPRAANLIKGTAPSVDARLASVSPDDICISSVTRAELLYGVHLKPGAHHLAHVVGVFLALIRSLAWDQQAADRFATIAAELTRAGSVISTFDTMIAAHALATDVVLVTNNVRHFSRVPLIRVENWTQPS